jgi:hypothetical protein
MSLSSDLALKANTIAKTISAMYHGSPIFCYVDLQKYNKDEPNKFTLVWTCVGTHDFNEDKFKSGFEHLCKTRGLTNWKVIEWGVPLDYENPNKKKESRNWMNIIEVIEDISAPIASAAASTDIPAARNKKQKAEQTVESA